MVPGGVPMPVPTPVPAPVPNATITQNRWCEDGETIVIGGASFNCHNDNFEHQPEVLAPILYSHSMDVPAESYTTPPSSPCKAQPSNGSIAITSCLVAGPETHYKCTDTARVLLTSEDGSHHCILFPPQQQATTTKTTK